MIKHWYEKRGKGGYWDKRLWRFIIVQMKPLDGFDDELLLIEKPKASPCERDIKRRQFWISIKKAKNCYFSRRNGFKGKIIRGYSVCIRLFNIDIL